MSGEWQIRFTKQAKKDVDSLSPKLKQKLRDILINTVANDPYVGKKLLGDLTGSFSIRLTHKDRLVYSLDEQNKIVYVERARTHYGR
ncbi:MAG: type II toxin-antitoxin system RelE/ParE family toxin [Armatimonadetes bacterium]|nr:type II toxin-antitoxin system RelE/ParE family toxin [Armatimonadota bacterium]